MGNSVVNGVAVSLLLSQSLIQSTNGFTTQPISVSPNRQGSFTAATHAVTRLDNFRANPNLLLQKDNRKLSTRLNVAQISTPAEKQEEKPDKKKQLKAEISNNPVSKFRKLKDIMWIREASEDLTAAEFACSVENQQRLSGNTQKRAVDYEKLVTQLDKRISDMFCQPVDLLDLSEGEPSLDKNRGMGRYVYEYYQRSALLTRILNTREKLQGITNGNEARERGDDIEIKLPEIPDLTLEIPKEGDSGSSGPKLYVRDDGTVDWDGALQDRAALKKFGIAVWARINGQNADDISEDDDIEATNGHGHDKPAVTVKIEDTPEIVKARDELNMLREELKDLQKSNTALLNSGISAGQAVANVNLASLKPALRNEIRLSAEALKKKEQQVSFQTLNYEQERIYTYLATELGNPAAKGYVPLQDRLNVAEYGLLESQIEGCSRDLESRGAVDEDILAVIAEQMTDFKRRLGIDYYVSGLTYDKEAIQTWLADALEQTKSGLGFYVKGCRLFWNDLLYCTSLIARAAQGYTLKPREVRNLRRTFKDIITFIPFVIILLIPLSPIGHVFVFGAIQRFFPDFFPSCFTEPRQNLLQLYESTEYSEVTINESFNERFSRFQEAIGFLVSSRSRDLYRTLMQVEKDENAEEK